MMKKYWIISSICAAAIFVLSAMIIGVFHTVYAGRVKKLVTELNENAVVMRYCMDEDAETSEIVHVVVRDRTNYRLDKLPQKADCRFLGLFGEDGRQYVSESGSGLLPLEEEMLLYARFAEMGAEK